MVKTIALAILLLFLVGWAGSIVLMKNIRRASPEINHYELNFHLGIIMILTAGCFYPNTNIAQ